MPSFERNASVQMPHHSMGVKCTCTNCLSRTFPVNDFLEPGRKGDVGAWMELIMKDMARFHCLDVDNFEWNASVTLTWTQKSDSGYGSDGPKLDTPRSTHTAPSPSLNPRPSPPAKTAPPPPPPQKAAKAPKPTAQTSPPTPPSTPSNPPVYHVTDAYQPEEQPDRMIGIIHNNEPKIVTLYEAETLLRFNPLESPIGVYALRDDDDDGKDFWTSSPDHGITRRNLFSREPRVRNPWFEDDNEGNDRNESFSRAHDTDFGYDYGGLCYAGYDWYNLSRSPCPEGRFQVFRVDDDEEKLRCESPTSECLLMPRIRRPRPAMPPSRLARKGKLAEVV